jgi:hypothetical protein
MAPIYEIGDTEASAGNLDWRVLLDHDSALEIEPRGEAEVFVKGPA